MHCSAKIDECYFKIDIPLKKSPYTFECTGIHVDST